MDRVGARVMPGRLVETPAPVGWSVSTMAALPGVSHGSVSMWERGRPCLNVTMLAAYAAVLGRPVHGLVNLALEAVATPLAARPMLQLVPSPKDRAATLLADAREGRLKATPDYPTMGSPATGWYGRPAASVPRQRRRAAPARRSSIATNAPALR